MRICFVYVSFVLDCSLEDERLSPCWMSKNHAKSRMYAYGAGDANKKRIIYHFRNFNGSPPETGFGLPETNPSMLRYIMDEFFQRNARVKLIPA
jgi:hypothetical protein